jgi:hypothetical protein
MTSSTRGRSDQLSKRGNDGTGSQARRDTIRLRQPDHRSYAGSRPTCASRVLTSQRADWWNRSHEELRVLYEHTKGNAHARCALWSHQLGWEVRLTIEGSLIRSRVTRSIDEAMTSREEWEAAMLSERRLELPRAARLSDRGKKRRRRTTRVRHFLRGRRELPPRGRIVRRGRSRNPKPPPKPTSVLQSSQRPIARRTEGLKSTCLLSGTVKIAVG